VSCLGTPVGDTAEPRVLSMEIPSRASFYDAGLEIKLEADHRIEIVTGILHEELNNSSLGSTLMLSLLLAINLGT
jgi:hypothetical protein